VDLPWRITGLAHGVVSTKKYASIPEWWDAFQAPGPGNLLGVLRWEWRRHWGFPESMSVQSMSLMCPALSRWPAGTSRFKQYTGPSAAPSRGKGKRGGGASAAAKKGGSPSPSKRRAAAYREEYDEEEEEEEKWGATSESELEEGFDAGGWLVYQRLGAGEEGVVGVARAVVEVQG
jgi:hypothetical protein